MALAATAAPEAEEGAWRWAWAQEGTPRVTAGGPERLPSPRGGFGQPGREQWGSRRSHCPGQPCSVFGIRELPSQGGESTPSRPDATRLHGTQTPQRQSSASLWGEAPERGAQLSGPKAGLNRPVWGSGLRAQTLPGAAHGSGGTRPRCGLTGGRFCGNIVGTRRAQDPFGCSGPHRSLRMGPGDASHLRIRPWERGTGNHHRRAQSRGLRFRAPLRNPRGSPALTPGPRPPARRRQ